MNWRAVPNRSTGPVCERPWRRDGLRHAGWATVARSCEVHPLQQDLESRIAPYASDGWLQAPELDPQFPGPDRELEPSKGFVQVAQPRVHSGNLGIGSNGLGKPLDRPQQLSRPTSLANRGVIHRVGRHDFRPPRKQFAQPIDLLAGLLHVTACHCKREPTVMVQDAEVLDSPKLLQSVLRFIQPAKVDQEMDPRGKEESGKWVELFGQRLLPQGLLGA